MSYTGPAYVGKSPTDDWIAQKLVPNVDLSRRFSFGGRPEDRLLDIGQTTAMLLEEFQKSELAKLKEPFELLATGWQWKRGRRPLVGRRQPCPMSWTITKGFGKKFSTRVVRSPRYWHWNHQVQFAYVPACNLSDTARESWFANARDETKGIYQPRKIAEAFERAAIQTVSSVGAANPSVGRNCMCVLIAPPDQNAFVRVRFSACEPHWGQVVGKSFKSKPLPAAYTPWVIGPHSIHRPSIHIGPGSLEMNIGPFVVEIEGTEKSFDGVIGAIGSVDRPPRPQ
jgi:hypothetical protein